MSLRARARNSSNAWPITADSARPDAAACVRTRAISGIGSLTVNTAAGLAPAHDRTVSAPDVTVRLPGEQPN